MVNKAPLNVSILLTGVLLSALNYHLKPAPSDREIRNEARGMGTGVEWRGQIAPDFELKTTRGERFQLSENVGKKLIVLNFFATWCGPCQMELPQLETLWNEFKSSGDFRMLVVGREETDDVLRTFREKRGLTFPMASDPHGAAYGKFAAKYIPRTFLISRQGTIVHEWTGNYETEVAKLRKLLHRELAKK